MSGGRESGAPKLPKMSVFGLKIQCFRQKLTRGVLNVKGGGGALVKERFLIFTNFVIPSLIQKIAKLPNLGINPEPKAKHQQRHYRPFAPGTCVYKLVSWSRAIPGNLSLSRTTSA